jgi:hypothetical protein
MPFSLLESGELREMMTGWIRKREYVVRGRKTPGIIPYRTRQRLSGREGV